MAYSIIDIGAEISKCIGCMVKGSQYTFGLIVHNEYNIKKVTP